MIDNSDTSGNPDNKEQTDGSYKKNQNQIDGNETFYKMAWNAFAPRIKNLLSEEFDKNKNINQVLYNNLSSKVQSVRTEQIITRNNIDNTNKIIKTLGYVLSIILTIAGIILTIFIFAVNSQYMSTKDIINSNMQSIQTEIKAINQKLDYQEKLNNITIENEVRKQTTNKK